MMKARFLVLCAIALLTLLPTAATIAASLPTPSESRGASAYRNNLQKLRSHSDVQPQTKETDIEIEETLIETSVQTIKEQKIEQETLKSEELLLEPVIIIEVEQDFQEEKQNNLTERINSIPFMRRVMHQNAIASSRRDPYEIIAAARQHTNPSLELPIANYRIPDSLRQLSSEDTKTAIQGRIIQTRERLTYAVGQPRDTIKRRFQSATGAVRMRIAEALRWTAQTAHRAAEQVAQP